MTPALAIFVKTAGLSPVKTRLAATLGTAHATHFHGLAAAATAAVARQCRPVLTPYWAVAEPAPEASEAWPEFENLWQGTGGLGERLHQVYSELQARHGSVLLIGADAPQLTPSLLTDALHALAAPGNPFAMGNAADGGFWLFGGRVPIAREVWLGVRYSQADTGAQLRHALAASGGTSQLPTLADVDHASDLDLLAAALDALSDPLPAQCSLRDWLRVILSKAPQQVVDA